MVARSLYILLLSYSASVVVNAQQPQPQIAREPLFENYQDILEIIETHTYGVYEPAESPEAWGAIYSLTPGPDAGVLVSDPGMNLVYHVVPDRGVVSTFGSGEGEGPGEFRHATAAAWNGSTEVFVVDRRQMRTSVFTLDGEYLRTFPSHNARTVAIDSKGILWVSNSSSRSPSPLRRYDTESGEFLGEIGRPIQGEASNEVPSAEMVATSPGRVFSVKGYPYEIVEYSSTGLIQHTFGRFVRWIEPPILNEIGARQTVGGAVGGIGCFPDGKVIVFIARVIKSEDSGYEGYFDVFDAEMNWLTTIPADDLRKDRMAVRMTVARDGALWINWNGDYPTVTRYELSFK